MAANFLDLTFSVREIYNVKINVINGDPILASIEAGNLIAVTHVISAGNAQSIVGKIKYIKPYDIKHSNFSTHYGINEPGFVICLDCSKENESNVIIIRSSDIRNITVLNPDADSDLVGIIITNDGNPGDNLVNNGDGTATWTDVISADVLEVQEF